MSRKKIMRIMQENHWQCNGRSANVNRRVARLRLKTHVKPNLLKRRFRLHCPGTVLLTDGIFMNNEGNSSHLAYGSASIDSVTGWVYSFQVSSCDNLQLVISTMWDQPANQLEDAVKPMLHSDQCALYLADEFQVIVKELNLDQSMSRRGNCWDIACQESFFGHFRDECAYRKAQSLDELKKMIADYFQYDNWECGQWNRNRMTPVEFETCLNNMTEEEYKVWQEREETRYEQMKQQVREKAIERAKTQGV